MDDYILKLTSEIEPLIVDLPEKLEKLTVKKNELEETEKFLNFVNGNIELIEKYPDQEMIYKSFDDIEISLSDYKAFCYLLSNNNESIQNLPQYKDAKNKMKGLIDYYVDKKDQLIG